MTPRAPPCTHLVDHIQRPQTRTQSAIANAYTIQGDVPMYLQPDETKRNFRDARANLSALCRADHSTVVLSWGQPVAIVTPIDTKGVSHLGPKDRRLARAKRLFHQALDSLRTR